jgi:hypothetical protein
MLKSDRRLVVRVVFGALLMLGRRSLLAHFAFAEDANIPKIQDGAARGKSQQAMKLGFVAMRWLDTEPERHRSMRWNQAVSKPRKSGRMRTSA